MEIVLRGHLEPADFVRGQYLHMRPRRWLRWLGYPLLALYLAVLVLAFWQARRTGDGWVPAIVLLGIGIYVLLLLVVLLPARWRRLFRQQKTFELPVDIVIDVSGVRSKSELGQANLPWSYLRKWKRGKHAVLLYHSDVMFHLLPKRLLAHDDVDKLEGLLREHLGQAT